MFQVELETSIRRTTLNIESELQWNSLKFQTTLQESHKIWYEKGIEKKLNLSVHDNQETETKYLLSLQQAFNKEKNLLRIGENGSKNTGQWHQSW